MPQDPDLQKVADIAIAEAAIALRNNSIMPMLVNRDYDSEAAQRNKVIQVPIWHAMTVEDVTPGRGNENSPEGLVPDTVDIYLNNWKEVRFNLSDKEMAEVQDSRVLPPVMQRAVIAHADVIDLFILNGMYQSAWNHVDQAGATAVVADVINMRKALNVENVPRDANRRMVISDDTESELLAIDTFHEVDKVGDTLAIQTGSLGRKFGFNPIVTDGQMPSHTQGTASLLTVSGAHAAEAGFSGGTSLVTLSATTNLAVGDLVTFGGVGPATGKGYAIVSVVSGTVIEVAPRLRTALANLDAVAYLAGDPGGDHAIGALGFHQGGYAFSTRPLQTSTTPGVIVSQATDPVSGLSLRVTVEYVNKSLEWSLDILYGGKVIYSEMLTRLVR